MSTQQSDGVVERLLQRLSSGKRLAVPVSFDLSAVRAFLTEHAGEASNLGLARTLMSWAWEYVQACGPYAAVVILDWHCFAALGPDGYEALQSLVGKTRSSTDPDIARMPLMVSGPFGCTEEHARQYAHLVQQLGLDGVVLRGIRAWWPILQAFSKASEMHVWVEPSAPCDADELATWDDRRDRRMFGSVFDRSVHDRVERLQRARLAQSAALGVSLHEWQAGPRSAFIHRVVNGRGIRLDEWGEDVGVLPWMVHLSDALKAVTGDLDARQRRALVQDLQMVRGEHVVFGTGLLATVQKSDGAPSPLSRAQTSTALHDRLQTMHKILLEVYT